jgi:hypothetical protein
LKQSEGKTMLKKMPIELLLNALPDMGIVVVDGAWMERNKEGILSQDPKVAGAAGRMAVLDDDVMDVGGIVSALVFGADVHPACLASALRSAWLGHGLHADPDFIRQAFTEAWKSREFLMNEEENKRFDELPAVVKIWRGQLFSDGTSPSSSSWTLSETVSDMFAAPVGALGLPHGWVISVLAPKSAILALFLERGEEEVVVDLAALGSARIEGRRGRASDVFPSQNASIRFSEEGES